MSIVCTVQITQLNGETSTTQLRFDSIEAATVDAVKTQLGIPIRKKKDKDGAESVDSLGGSNSSVIVGSPIDDNDSSNKNLRLKIWNPSMEKYLLFKDLSFLNLQYDKNGGEMTKFKIVKKKSKKGKDGKEGKEGKEKKKHKRTQSRDETADKKKEKTPAKRVDSKDVKESTKDSKETKELKDVKESTKDSKDKKSSWKGPMFGINLADVIDKQQHFLHNKSLVPLILFEISSYIRQKGGLKEEGLFRISGAAQQVDDLKKLYDKKGSVDLNAQAPSIHSAASLLKQFFRELPEPLFPRRYYSTLIKVSKNPNPDSKLNNLKLIVSKLPKINKHSLIYLLKFLKEVAVLSDVNKMTPTNLGTVWGPNLIKEPPSDEPVNLANFSQLMDSEHINALICMMLDNIEGFEALKEEDDTAEISTPIPPEHVPPPILPGPSLSMPAPQLLSPGSSHPHPPALITPAAAQSPQDPRSPAQNEQQMKIKKELLQNVALKKTIVTFDLGSTVRGKFDYAAQNIKMSNGETDISIKRGQEATVVENCPGGWVKVEMMTNDGKVSGCVPCNYLTTATVPKVSLPPAVSPLKPPLSPMEKRRSTIVPQDPKTEPVQTDFRSVLKKTEAPKKPAEPETKPEPSKLEVPAVKLTRPHSNTGGSPRALSKAHSFVAHHPSAVGLPVPGTPPPSSPAAKGPPARPTSLLVESPSPPIQSALQPPAVVEKALAAPPASPSKQLQEQLSGSSEWREATTSDGKKYYYNKRTRQTSWVVPEELVKVSQSANIPAPLVASPAPPKAAEPVVPASPAPVKAPEPKPEPAPSPSTATTSDWKAATAPNGKTYYYNVKTKETSWTKPGDMQDKKGLEKSESNSSFSELEKKLDEEEAEMNRQSNSTSDSDSDRQDGRSPSLYKQNDNSLSKEDIAALEEEEERLRIEEQLLELEREEKMMMQQESDSSETSSSEASDDEDDAAEEARIEELRRKLEEEEARIQEEQRRIQERKAKLAEEERKIREASQKQKKKSKTKADEELPELPQDE